MTGTILSIQTSVGNGGPVIHLSVSDDQGPVYTRRIMVDGSTEVGEFEGRPYYAVEIGDLVEYHPQPLGESFVKDFRVMGRGPIRNRRGT